MSLYDDIIVNDKDGGASGSKSAPWKNNSGIKLLQDHLQLKKRESLKVHSNLLHLLPMSNNVASSRKHREMCKAVGSKR